MSRLGQMRIRHERCEFTGGRDDLGDGQACQLFGGTDGDVTAPEPAWAVDRTEVEERLRDFTGWIGG
ncbi:MAG TPA: hypothetical protein VKV80_15325 [Streptosporangiaceae bacterium]|nr:hypothetical protein [Streptosporangiaceae bacterium]